MSLTLKDLDFVIGKEPMLVFICAKSKCGKTHLLKSLISAEYNRGNRFTFGIILANNPDPEKNYYSWFPKECVYNNGANLMNNFHNYINILKEKRKKKGSALEANVIIIDDPIGMVDWYGKEFQSFLSIYRHYNTTVFILSQSVTQGASTLLRDQATHVFMGYPSRKVAKEAYYDNFGNASYSKKDDFYQRLKDCHTSIYNFCVFINNAERIGDYFEKNPALNYISYCAKETMKYPVSVLPDYNPSYKTDKTSSKTASKTASSARNMPDISPQFTKDEALNIVRKYKNQDKQI